MSTTNGRQTTASRMARLSVVVLTAACCVAIVFNALFLQPPASQEAANDQGRLVGDAAGRHDTVNLVSEISVSPEDPIARLVTQGDPMVNQIQTELLRLGYYSGAANGVADAPTKDAIIAYEKASGLPPIGDASRPLLDHILYTRQVAAAARYTASLKPSAPNGDVRRVQAALVALGFDAGPADGVMGDKTRKAIRTFQTYRGLPATGQIDASLARELGIVLAAEG